MKLNLNNLKPDSKVKLKEVFTDSFRPFKNGDGLMDIYCGKVVTIKNINYDIIFRFNIKESSEWVFGADYIDYIVNDNQMDIE